MKSMQYSKPAMFQIRQLFILGVVVILATVCLSCKGSDTTSQGDSIDIEAFIKSTSSLLHQDILINADIWYKEPMILSANYGFDNIIGVPGGEKEVRAAGGTWNSVQCSNGQEPDRRALTSSPQPFNMALTTGVWLDHADGLPVVFSWPLLPSTLDATDFRVTLNTGETVIPHTATISPNLEYNERNTAVLFGEFGNRRLPEEPGAVYVVTVEIVADSTPLTLVGPGGRLVSAVGMSKDATSNPYVTGPSLVGAKLNRLTDAGEGAPALFAGQLPNDGIALYGSQGQYRLRVLTTGGFSPDGVGSVLPTEFERFFRVHLKTANGETVVISKVNVDYEVDGGKVRVIGLAELGTKEAPGNDGTPGNSFDNCYVEDHDNYIDIILAGDEQAVRRITDVEIPASGGYSPFYNPGGPGNAPTPNVRYTAPGPYDLQPVAMALDDPMTVTYTGQK